MERASSIDRWQNILGELRQCSFSAEGSRVRAVLERALQAAAGAAAGGSGDAAQGVAQQLREALALYDTDQAASRQMVERLLADVDDAEALLMLMGPKGAAAEPQQPPQQPPQLQLQYAPRTTAQRSSGPRHHGSSGRGGPGMRGSSAVGRGLPVGGTYPHLGVLPSSRPFPPGARAPGSGSSHGAAAAPATPTAEQLPWYLLLQDLLAPGQLLTDAGSGATSRHALDAAVVAAEADALALAAGVPQLLAALAELCLPPEQVLLAITHMLSCVARPLSARCTRCSAVRLLLRSVSDGGAGPGAFVCGGEPALHPQRPCGSPPDTEPDWHVTPDTQLLQRNLDMAWFKRTTLEQLLAGAMRRQAALPAFDAKHGRANGKRTLSDAAQAGAAASSDAFPAVHVPRKPRTSRGSATPPAAAAAAAAAGAFFAPGPHAGWDAGGGATPPPQLPPQQQHAMPGGGSGSGHLVHVLTELLGRAASGNPEARHMLGDMFAAVAEKPGAQQELLAILQEAQAQQQAQAQHFGAPPLHQQQPQQASIPRVGLSDLQAALRESHRPLPDALGALLAGLGMAGAQPGAGAAAASGGGHDQLAAQHATAGLAALGQDAAWQLPAQPRLRAPAVQQLGGQPQLGGGGTAASVLSTLGLGYDSEKASLVEQMSGMLRQRGLTSEAQMSAFLSTLVAAMTTAAGRHTQPSASLGDVLAQLDETSVVAATEQALQAAMRVPAGPHAAPDAGTPAGSTGARRAPGALAAAADKQQQHGLGGAAGLGPKPPSRSVTASSKAILSALTSVISSAAAKGPLNVEVVQQLVQQAQTAVAAAQAKEAAAAAAQGGAPPDSLRASAMHVAAAALLNAVGAEAVVQPLPLDAAAAAAAAAAAGPGTQLQQQQQQQQHDYELVVKLPMNEGHRAMVQQLLPKLQLPNLRVVSESESSAAAAPGAAAAAAAAAAVGEPAPAGSEPPASAGGALAGAPSSVKLHRDLVSLLLLLEPGSFKHQNVHETLKLLEDSETFIADVQRHEAACAAAAAATGGPPVRIQFMTRLRPAGLDPPAAAAAAAAAAAGSSQQAAAAEAPAAAAPELAEAGAGLAAAHGGQQPQQGGMPRDATCAGLAELSSHLHAHLEQLKEVKCQLDAQAAAGQQASGGRGVPGSTGAAAASAGRGSTAAGKLGPGALANALASLGGSTTGGLGALLGVPPHAASSLAALLQQHGALSPGGTSPPSAPLAAAIAGALAAAGGQSGAAAAGGGGSSAAPGSAADGLASQLQHLLPPIRTSSQGQQLLGLVAALGAAAVGTPPASAPAGAGSAAGRSSSAGSGTPHAHQQQPGSAPARVGTATASVRVAVVAPPGLLLYGSSSGADGAGEQLQELFCLSGELPLSQAAALPAVLLAVARKPRSEIRIDMSQSEPLLLAPAPGSSTEQLQLLHALAAAKAAVVVDLDAQRQLVLCPEGGSLSGGTLVMGLMFGREPLPQPEHQAGLEPQQQPQQPGRASEPGAAAAARGSDGDGGDAAAAEAAACEAAPAGGSHAQAAAPMELDDPQACSEPAPQPAAAAAAADSDAQPAAGTPPAGPAAGAMVPATAAM